MKYLCKFIAAGTLLLVIGISPLKTFVSATLMTTSKSPALAMQQQQLVNAADAIYEAGLKDVDLPGYDAGVRYFLQTRHDAVALFAGNKHEQYVGSLIEVFDDLLAIPHVEQLQETLSMDDRAHLYRRRCQLARIRGEIIRMSGQQVTASDTQVSTPAEDRAVGDSRF